MLIPIAPTEAEARREAVMRAIARAHAAGTEAGEWPPAPMIGGTALRIIHGVPRPSVDLDFVVLDEHRQLTRTELSVCAVRAGYRVGRCRKADGDRQWKLTIKRPGWFREKTTLFVDETAARAHERKHLRSTLQNGIRSYGPEDLFRLKTDALVRGPRPGMPPRAKARDAFDTAFILERFPADLDDSRILEIAEVARKFRTGSTRDVWLRAFNSDAIMQRADCDAVWEALEQGLAEPLAQARDRAEHGEAAEREHAAKRRPEQDRERQSPARQPSSATTRRTSQSRGLID